jgi:hypothetical protein
MKLEDVTLDDILENYIKLENNNVKTLYIGNVDNTNNNIISVKNWNEIYEVVKGINL